MAFPHAIVLNVGEFSVGDAQRILVGPKWFKVAANKLVESAEKVGGYEKDEAACSKLFRAYRGLLNKLINDGDLKPTPRF